ncbi:MAG: VWA domain-containing protein [Vicinamibacterales bacterium]
MRAILVAAALAVLFLVPAGRAQEPQTGQPAGKPKAQQSEEKARQSGQQAQQQPPTFRAGINFVRVDVIVTDKRGEPVSDLRLEDFEVTEDGKPQRIETFKLVRIGEEVSAVPPRQIRTAYDEESEAARDDVRLFAIFLDDYHVRLGASMAVREPLKRFIQTSLGPSDMVALMYPLTPLSDVRMSRDRDAVMGAIDKFEGRKYNYQPRNYAEEKYAMYPASVVERIRNQVSMGAIKALVTRLGSLREGRKALILVSEGYSNYLPPQLRDPIASMPGLGNIARGRPGYDNPETEERAAFFVNTDIQRDLRDVFDAANRNNTAIYALDPRGLATHEYDINEGVGMETDRMSLQSTMDTLRVLASETDGRAIVNRNDLDAGLRQAVKDSSAYYLLGYNSTEAPSDGKFHQIRVRIRRPGVQVRARKGYWALTAEERETALAPPKPGPAPAVTEALASIIVPRGRLTRTWIGTSRGDNGRTLVTFAWESVPPAPGTAPRAEPKRVMLTASGPDGRLYFRGRVPDASPGDGSPSMGAVAAAATSQAARPATATVRAHARFEADPGLMQIRIAVEGENGQVLDSETREISVPDLTAPQVSLSTPVVFRARNALEFRALLNESGAIPAAGREFSRTERLLVRFDVYAPGTETPAPAARLLNRTGAPINDLPVQRAAGGAAYQIDLPLAGLAAGEYLLEISVKADDGEVKHLTGMRITG